jgi:hypothetical protein
MAFDPDLARLRDRGEEFARFRQMADQRRCPAIDEALGQPVVERVGELVLDGERPILPAGRIVEPAGPMRDVGPGADMGDPLDQRVDLAFGSIEPADLGGHPIPRQPLGRAGQMVPDLAEQPGMVFAHDLAEIWDLADIPEQPHGSGMRGPPGDVRVAQQRFERPLIIGLAHAEHDRQRGRRLEAAQQQGGRAEIEG